MVSAIHTGIKVPIIALEATSNRRSNETPKQLLRNRRVVKCVLVPNQPGLEKRDDGNSVMWKPAPIDRVPCGDTISRDDVRTLEQELDTGESVLALKRFNEALQALPEDYEIMKERMWRVWNELCFNLESFNPVFTAVMLKVQCTIGLSDYEARDEALQQLIIPLGGEYGLSAGSPLKKTHRQLFAEFYESVTGDKLSSLLQRGVRPVASEELFSAMLRDVSTGGGLNLGPMEQATYALGYNLAVEYLAAYEKTWMLESFRHLARKCLSAANRSVSWEFLEIHAIGEPEHAEIGHNAVVALVPEEHNSILRKSMLDHDRDFAVFYNHLADILASHK